MLLDSSRRQTKKQSEIRPIAEVTKPVVVHGSPIRELHLLIYPRTAIYGRSHNTPEVQQLLI